MSWEKMLTLTRSGSMAAVIAQARSVPERVIPYAASTALTRVALQGRAAVLAEMPRVFRNPTPYALRSTRVVPSTVQTLAARVQVNEDATNNGTPAEKFLFPEVFGGHRKEKRFERHLRYAGILRAGSYVVPGQSAPLDAYGNFKAREIQRIFTAVRGSFDPAQNRTRSARSRRNAKKAQYFVGGLDSVSIVGGEQRVVRSAMKPGIYRRDGRGVKPVMIFTSKAPTYRRRLDFEGIARQVAEDNFEVEFLKAAAAIVQRRGG